MAKNTKPDQEAAKASMARLTRPLTLASQVERLLRKAIADGSFSDGRLPTEVELAEQLGVSRETVRLAAEVLQREGLLVKIRRKGTFTRPPTMALQLRSPESTVLAFLQAIYPGAQGTEEAVAWAINSLMLQGAVAEAGAAGWELLVRNAPNTQMRTAFQNLKQKALLAGVIFASFGEEKLLRRVTGLGIPTVLLDHDLHLPQISSVREDSSAGAQQAVRYLASLGHRRIAMAYWRRTDLNPWRLDGYRLALRESGLARKRSWEFAVELTERGAQMAARQLLELSPRPTAIYCFNNTLAKRIVHELREHQVQIPEEISVLGGGGEEVFGMTCHQADWHQMGRAAVQVLMRHLRDAKNAEPEHHVFPHTLQIGETTSAPS